MGIKSVLDVAFPPENRVNAGVAAIRTFGQSLWGTVPVVGIGGMVVTSEMLDGTDWRAFGISAGAVLLSSGIAAARAWWDVATSGMSRLYTDMAEARASTPETEGTVQSSGFDPLTAKP